MKSIYIDLDCILDTRLALINELNPAVAKALVCDERYHLREQDDWTTLTHGVITTEQFNEHWKSRTVDLLRRGAMTTNAFAFLKKVLADYHVNMVDGVETEDAGLVINLYPYEFTEEEKHELAAILREFFYQELPIDYCFLSMDEVTPKHLDENYHVGFMYSLVPWLKKHHFGIVNLPMKKQKFELVFPRLFEHSSTLSNERKQEEITMWMSIWMDHMVIEFIHAHWMSVISPSFIREGHRSIMDDMEKQHKDTP